MNIDISRQNAFFEKWPLTANLQIAYMHVSRMNRVFIHKAVVVTDFDAQMCLSTRTQTQLVAIKFQFRITFARQDR
jgi:hypothetical protein